MLKNDEAAHASPDGGWGSPGPADPDAPGGAPAGVVQGAPPHRAPAWDPGLVSCADRSRESDQRLRPQEALRPADIEGPGAGASRTTGVRG